jgi:hypothetical protein
VCHLTLQVISLSSLTIALAVPSANAFQIFSWANAVSGYADVPTNWNPNGVPSSVDYVMANLAGGYQIVFPAAVASTFEHDYQGSGVNVTLSFSSPHTTGQFFVNGGTPTIAINQGTLTSNVLRVGQSGGNSTFLIDNAAIVHSGSVYTSGYGDVLGFDGTSTINVTGGGHFYSDHTGSSSQDLVIAQQSTAVAGVTVAGSTSIFPRSYSGLHTTGGTNLVVGNNGNASLVASGGAFVDVSGNVVLAQLPGSTGNVVIGPSGSVVIEPTFMLARSNLWIGRDFYQTGSGHAELTIKNRSFVNVTGGCEVGSSANDQGCALHVLQGGTLIAGGGLLCYPTAGNPLDLQGGTTHVSGGAFTWPSGKLLTVSSQVGTPFFWIDNGSSSTGPAMAGPSTNGLMVGRGGSGTVRLAGSGTVFNMTGAITLGDSVGGTGTLSVDSLAQLPYQGYLVVGNNGTGEVDVLGEGKVQSSYTFIASSPGSTGRLRVQGESTTAYSQLDVRGDMYIGGGISGAGGAASAVVDSGGGVVVVPPSGSVNPALVKLFAGDTVTVGHDALVRAAPGTIDDQGAFVLHGGDVEFTNGMLVESGATVRGWGYLDLGQLNNLGVIAPYGSTGPFGSLIFTYSSYLQNASGHYAVTLGSALRCDTLVVHGPATIAGTLDLSLDPSFVRTVGDTFTVLIADSMVTGRFTTVTWNGNPLTGQAQIVYLPKAVKVAIETSTNECADLTLGPSGSTLPGQSFNETRGVDVIAQGSGAFDLTSMTLRQFSIGTPSGMVGARIYDSGTHALIASKDSTVAMGTNQTLTLPISVVMNASHTYRACFFISAGASSGSGTLFDPDPPGSGGFPYVDASGAFQVVNAYDGAADAFPISMNNFVPLMTLCAQSTAGVSPPSAPVGWRMQAVRPNPATDAAFVEFTLPEHCSVVLEEFSVTGERVARWDRTLDPGTQSLPVMNHGLPQGLYILRLSAYSQSGGLRFSAAHKITVIGR